MHNIVEALQIISFKLSTVKSEARLVDVDRGFLAASAALLPHLDRCGEDLPTAAIAITEKTWHTDDVTLTDPRRTNFTGLSGLPLFFAKAKGAVLATIKAFPVDSPQFAQALWATHHLHRLTGQCPQLRALGLARDCGHDYFLIAQEFVPGELVNDRIIALAAMSHGSMRYKELDALRCVIYKLGAFLGKLHHVGKPYFGSALPRIVDTHERAFIETLDGLNRMPALGVNVAALSSSAQDIFDAMAHHEYRYAYNHGDAHPGNYLYDSEHDRIVALDLDACAKTIGASHEPLGSPFTDYIKLTASMTVRELMGITPNETLALRTAFDNGYTAFGGTLPSETITAYYTLMEVFDYAAWYFQHEHHLVPDVKAFMHKILLTGVTWLNDILRNH